MRQGRLVAILAVAVLAASCQIPGPPVALDDIVDSPSRGEVAVNVVANDFITGDDFAVRVVDGPSCGELVDEGPTIVVQVGPECPDVLMLEYELVDADFGASDRATIEIRLPFRSVHESLITAAGTPIQLPLNRQEQEIAVVQEPANGALTSDGGALVYIPAEDFRGIDTIALSVGDGGLVFVYEVAILHLSADPLQVDFPTVELGQAETVTIQLQNTGALDLPLTPLLLGEAFELADSSCGDLIAPGVDCQITIAFAPGSEGVFDGRLDIPYGNGGLSVGLTGAAGTAELYFEAIPEVRADLVVLPPTKLGRLGEYVPLFLYNQSTINAQISFDLAPPLTFDLESSGCPDELPGLERCPLAVAVSGQPPLLREPFNFLPPFLFFDNIEFQQVAGLEPLTYADLLANYEPPAPVPLTGTTVALGPEGELRALVRLEGEIVTPIADLDLRIDEDDVDVESVGFIRVYDDAVFTVRNVSSVPITVSDVLLRPFPDTPTDGFALGTSTCLIGTSQDLIPDETCEVVLTPLKSCASAWLEIVSDAWPRLLVKVRTDCVD